MPLWVALIGAILSVAIALASLFATIEAQRTGKLRLFFWHVGGWGERELHPRFFKIGLAGGYGRTFFFFMIALAFCAFALEDTGFLR